jgi:hypothetical protein
VDFDYVRRWLLEFADATGERYGDRLDAILEEIC